jgi:hypothetical protein
LVPIFIWVGAGATITGVVVGVGVGVTGVVTGVAVGVGATYGSILMDPSSLIVRINFCIGSSLR